MSAVSRLSAAAVAATIALAVPAQAQVTFAGFTNGCFYTAGACAPGTGTGGTASTLGNLTYRTSTFNGTTSSIDGSLGLGAAAGTPNIGNLGSFALANGTYDYNPGSFMFRVTFTSPSGTTPGNQLFMADVMGSVVNSDGGVRIDFDNNPMIFTYTGGTFSLVLDDVSLIRSATAGAVSEVALTGFIRTTSVVPEPSTYVLMASGLAGLGFAARRRRRNG